MHFLTEKLDILTFTYIQVTCMYRRKTFSQNKLVNLQQTQCVHTNQSSVCPLWPLHFILYTYRERDVAQSIACTPLKRSVIGSILLSGPSCSLGYFPFQPVVHNWFIKGRGMYCSVYGKVHIKDPLLLIEKSSLCGSSGFPSNKCVNVTIWMTSNNRW